VAARAASPALRARLTKLVESIETVDTHEHIIPEKQRLSEPIDFFTLAGHYANNDAVSAGMEPKSKDFLKFWPKVKFTGYGEALRIAIRDIYGIAEISERTLPKINEAIAAKNKPGLYREILTRRCRMKICLNDQYWAPVPEPLDTELFALAQKFDGFIMPITPAGVQVIEKQSDTSITSAATLKRAMEKQFERALKAGMVTIKSTAAYQRDLYFRDVTAEEAERSFAALIKGSEPASRDRRPYRDLADHMFHHLCSLADAHRMPFQVHTGTQAGNGNYVANTKPAQLTNVLLKFPRVQFDLFHIGYPYWRECLILAKMFPNAYADFCWMHILTPTGARTAMHEFLDAVPANKIMGYGGDYRYPELSYAHLVIARKNIVQVLAERTEAGQNTENEAAELARMLLHDNPAAVFLNRSRAIG
jgi:predicted TIM-barrel fold metal-dependent hydrolase